MSQSLYNSHFYVIDQGHALPILSLLQPSKHLKVFQLQSFGLRHELVYLILFNTNIVKIYVTLDIHIKILIQPHD